MPRTCGTHSRQSYERVVSALGPPGEEKRNARCLWLRAADALAHHADRTGHVEVCSLGHALGSCGVAHGGVSACQGGGRVRVPLRARNARIFCLAVGCVAEPDCGPPLPPLDDDANRALSLQQHNRLARPLYPKHVRRLRSRIKAGTASSLAARHNPPPTPAPPNGRARGLKQRKPQLQHPL